MWNLFSSACSRVVSPRRLAPRLLLAAACTWATAVQAAPLPTTTTLTLSSPLGAAPTEVALTASVTGSPVPSTGTVTFCNASARLCEDAAILGKAQLVAGTATLRIIPAIGIHTYKAVFNGTTTAAKSTSTAQTLTVTGLYPTTTTITDTGNPSGYGLTATVLALGSNSPLLTGTVSFQDTSAGNYVLGTATLGTPTFSESFIPAQTPPMQTGNSPAIAGVGDFNEDGIPDLAIENAGDDTVSILLGKGDGTFLAAAAIPAIGTPPCETISLQSNCAIVVGDFNDDGHADLALTSGNDNTVVIFKGNGQGSFTPFSGSPIAVGNFPEALKIGDFNNDGIQDLAVANAKDSTISILLGNGDGTFTAASASPISAGIGSFPFFLAVGDFNGDGNADLAVVNGQDNSVSILLGNGEGGFTPAPGSPIGFPSASGLCPIVAADFNGDGIIDLAVAAFDTNAVYILLGNGDGTFALPSKQIGVGR